MHFHFDFSAAQILWTLTFAAELVLLVVLLGRDRVRRFPWFTANIVVMALLLLTSRLLFNRIPRLTAGTVFLALSDVVTLVSWLVVVEVARRGFAGASRRGWTIGVLVLLAVGGVVLWLWGPWPAWKTFAGGSRIAVMRGMQMFADKGSVLAAVLDVQLGILLVLVGRRFRGGWRSHPQMIAIGLSTAALAQLAVRAIWQVMVAHTTIHSQAEYLRMMTLRERIYHGNNVVYLCALVWWIAWLWRDEPGMGEPGMEAPGTGRLGTGEPVKDAAADA